MENTIPDVTSVSKSYKLKDNDPLNTYFKLVSPTFSVRFNEVQIECNATAYLSGE